MKGRSPKLYGSRNAKCNALGSSVFINAGVVTSVATQRPTMDGSPRAGRSCFPALRRAEPSAIAEPSDARSLQPVEFPDIIRVEVLASRFTPQACQSVEGSTRPEPRQCRPGPSRCCRADILDAVLIIVVDRAGLVRSQNRAGAGAILRPRFLAQVIEQLRAASTDVGGAGMPSRIFSRRARRSSFDSSRSFS